MAGRAGYVKDGEVLSAREQSFVLAYVGEAQFNATQAAILAGYSRKSAGQRAGELMTRPYVKEAIEVERRALAKRHKISADRIVSELAKIAFSNMYDYIQIDDETGETQIDLTEMTRDQAGAVSEFSTDEVFTKGGDKTLKQKIKLHDKMRALELLGKHIGMNFVNKVELTTLTNEQLIERAIAAGLMEIEPEAEDA